MLFYTRDDTQTPAAAAAGRGRRSTIPFRKLITSSIFRGNIIKEFNSFFSLSHALFAHANKSYHPISNPYYYSMRAATTLLAIFKLLPYCNCFLRSSCHNYLQIIDRYRIYKIHTHAPTSATSTEDRHSNSDSQLFLRFSPLIGGPALLPLHVELLLIPPTATRKEKENIEYVLKNATNQYFDIHRFDFLPENPRDSDTIARLMQFHGVPGNVRYRHYPVEQKGTDNLLESGVIPMDDRNILWEPNSQSSNGKGERGVIILLALATCSQSILKTAIAFANDYRTSEGKELRILGGKNCLSFVLDMILHLDEVHGLNVKMLTPRLL